MNRALNIGGQAYHMDDKAWWVAAQALWENRQMIKAEVLQEYE